MRSYALFVRHRLLALKVCVCVRWMVFFPNDNTSRVRWALSQADPERFRWDERFFCDGYINNYLVTINRSLTARQMRKTKKKSSWVCSTFWINGDYLDLDGMQIKLSVINACGHTPGWNRFSSPILPLIKRSAFTVDITFDNVDFPSGWLVSILLRT